MMTASIERVALRRSRIRHHTRNPAGIVNREIERGEMNRTILGHKSPAHRIPDPGNLRERNCQTTIKP
jgi:hypothetical protein